MRDSDTTFHLGEDSHEGEREGQESMEVAAFLTKQQLDAIDELLAKLAALPEGNESVASISKFLHSGIGADGKSFTMNSPAKVLHTNLGNLSKPKKSLIMLVPKQTCFVFNQYNTLGNALFGSRFMSKFRRLWRQKWFQVVFALGFLVSISCAALCFLPGGDFLSWLAGCAFFYGLSVWSHFQLDVLQKLAVKFNSIFMLMNLIGLGIGLSILFKWDVGRSLVALVVHPINATLGVFLDALPTKTRRNSFVFNVFGFMSCVFGWVGLQLDIFDIEQDVFLGHGVLEISIKERCKSFLFNLAILYFAIIVQALMEQRTKSGDVSGLTVPLVERKSSSNCPPKTNH